MKIRLLSALALLTLATGCQTRPSPDDVVSEKYIHRYGVPIPADQWSDRGQHGQICSTRRDGVVVAKTYDSGQLHGECSYTFPHSSLIQKKENYDSNTLTSETHYYPNGVPQKQIDYDGSGSKTLTKWFDNGAPQRKEVYSGDSLSQAEYFNQNNQVESQVFEGEGVRTRRDNYGQLLSNDEIRNGQMVERKTFHPNGVPASITAYNQGVIHGQRCTYSMSGEPLTIETWVNDSQHGTTAIYQNGAKVSDQPYVQGIRHGVERRYRDGDQMVQEVTWKDDQQHGPCHSYFDNGKQTDWYFQGRHVNKQTFDALSNQ
jgi:antitoxin component YwqK of YwqJK toxin-antitoxin module